MPPLLVKVRIIAYFAAVTCISVALVGLGFYQALQLSHYPQKILHCITDISVFIQVPLNVLFGIISILTFHFTASSASSFVGSVKLGYLWMYQELQDQNQLQPLFIPPHQQGQGQNNVADAG